MKPAALLDLAEAIGQRFAPLPPSVCSSERERIRARIRWHRAHAKARGQLDMPSWFWTASEDKALIDFVRAHPVYYRGYWADAARCARDGCKAHSASWRWQVLRKAGVPLPPIAMPQGKAAARKYSVETIDAVLARAQVARRETVAREFGLSKCAVDKIIQRYGGKPAKAPRREFTAEELDDIRLGEQLWKSYFEE